MISDINSVNGNIGGQPPYGYSFNEKKNNWVVNNFEKIILLSIFKLAQEGKSLIQIAQELNKRNLPSPKKKKWSYKTISYLFAPRRIEVYAGSIDGVQGKYEPIISIDFAKKILDLKLSGNAKSRPRVNKYLLSGTIGHCAWCGGPVKTSRSKSKNKEFLYYQCTRKTLYGKDFCPDSKLILQQTVNDIFLKEIAFTILRIKNYKKYYKVYQDNEFKKAGKELDILDSKITNKNGQINNFKNNSGIIKCYTEIIELLGRKKDILLSNVEKFDFNEYIKDCNDIKSKPIKTQIDIIKKYFKVFLHRDYITIEFPFPVDNNLSFSKKIDIEN